MPKLPFLLFIFAQLFCAAASDEESLSKVGPAQWHILDRYPDTCSYGPGLHIFIVKPPEGLIDAQAATFTPIKVIYQREFYGTTEALRYANVIAKITTNDEPQRSSLSVDVKTLHDLYKPGRVHNNVFFIHKTNPFISPSDFSTKTLYYPIAYDERLQENHYIRVSSSHQNPRTSEDGRVRYAAVKIEYVVGYDAQEIFSCDNFLREYSVLHTRFSHHRRPTCVKQK